MATDYTDFIVIICDSGERVVHKSHFRRRDLRNDGNLKLSGQQYRTMLDRAYRTRWMPWLWEEFKWKKPWLTINEIFRKKKIGILIFQEPDESSDTPEEPIHVSRIYQPSGGRIGQIPPPTGLITKITPFILKMIVDSSNKYRKAYKSYAFGIKQAIMSRWLAILLIAVAGVVLLLYFTGYIRV